MKVKLMKAKDIMYSKTVQRIENYKTYWTLPHPKVSACLTHLGIGVPVTRIVFGSYLTRRPPPPYTSLPGTRIRLLLPELREVEDPNGRLSGPPGWAAFDVAEPMAPPDSRPLPVEGRLVVAAITGPPARADET